MRYIALLLLGLLLAAGLTLLQSRRAIAASGGGLRTEVDRLNLPEAEAAYAASRKAYFDAVQLDVRSQDDGQLERLVFLLDRIHRLQGMTHGAGARDRWKTELQQEARAGLQRS